MTIRNLYPTSRPSLSLNFARVKALDPRITFTRASAATYYDADGVLRTASNNQARFDHDPVTGESLGLLIEEQRTNLVLRSEAFELWTRIRTTVSANTIIAPDGSLTADKMVEDATTGEHYVERSVTPAAGTYTMSVYVKAAEYSTFTFRPVHSGETTSTSSITFNLATGPTSTTNGRITNATMQDVGNGWKRCTVTLSITSATTSFLLRIQLINPGLSYEGNDVNGIYVWGAQVEVGSFPTSYIKTEASQVTRLEDAASMTGTNFSSWYRPDEGTVFVDALATFSGGSSQFVGFDSGGSNRWRVGHTGGNSTNFLVVIGGSVVTNINRIAPLGSYNKSAASYGAGDNNSFVANASAPVTSVNAGIPVVDKMTIGSAAAVATRRVLIKKIAYYPQRITDTQLQALTR
jgi:hypothetical protein